MFLLIYSKFIKKEYLRRHRKMTTFDKLALINVSLLHTIPLKIDTLHYF